jgi:hypothetical protein
MMLGFLLARAGVGLVSDHVKPAAPAEPTKSLVDKLVEKFGHSLIRLVSDSGR